MPKTGRPPMTDEQINERIKDYCVRYRVKERNEAGFPVFPAGLRETDQHYEWIALYKLFNRAKRRSRQTAVGSDPAAKTDQPCRVCLKPVRPAGSLHRRCDAAVALVRDLGPQGLDRIRAEAFPDDSGTPVARPKAKGRA